MKKFIAFRLRRRALARYSSALWACGVLATIPNAVSCTNKNSPSQKNNQITEEISSFNTSPAKNHSQIDIDLTKMSSTMVFAEVFNMLISPEEYTNKTVKAKGNFQVYESDNNKRYFAILIPDTTKCCQQGIEFIYQGEHIYPDDYPEIGEEISITGSYNITEISEGISYAYLDVWEITKS